MSSGDIPAPHTAPVPVTTTFDDLRHPSTSSGWRTTTQLFEPPKPNEFDIATRTALPPRRTDDEIEIAVDVALDQVRIDGHLAAMNGEGAHRDLDCACGGDQVSHRALGGAHVDAHHVVAEHGARRSGFAAVVHAGRRAVRVQVVDVGGRRTGVGERCAHCLDRAVAVRRRIVMR
jgi:hypothetical protein